MRGGGYSARSSGGPKRGRDHLLLFTCLPLHSFAREVCVHAMGQVREDLPATHSMKNEMEKGEIPEGA